MSKLLPPAGAGYTAKGATKSSDSARSGRYKIGKTAYKQTRQTDPPPKAPSSKGGATRAR